MNGWMDTACIDGWTHMDGRMDGGIDGQMDGRMDGGMDGPAYISLVPRLVVRLHVW